MSKKNRRWGRWIANSGHIDGGGQGLIYIVADTQGEHVGEYVLKELKNSKRAERFQREVSTLTKLATSEYVVPIVDSYISDDLT